MPETRKSLRHTERRRKTFVRVLAETYDVEAALAAAGLSWPDVCELRARYPEFALQFEEVIAAGYDRLEALLLCAAGVGRAATLDSPLAQALLKQRRTGKAEAATAAARRAAGPADVRKQMINDILRETAPLKAALNGRGGGDVRSRMAQEALAGRAA